MTKWKGHLMDTTVTQPAGVIYGLYCTCHPEAGIRYVGRTIRPPRKRLIQHKGDARRGSKYPVHKWIVKHGEQNVFMEILEAVESYDMLAEAEGRWMEIVSGRGCSLLNMATVEDGVLLYRHSAETRAKISAINLGKKIPQSVIDFRREAFSGEGNAMSKLTESEVAEICTLIWESVPSKDIACIYGIAHSTITKITKGERWANVPRPWGDSAMPDLRKGCAKPSRRTRPRSV